jgi:multimeric flavodoxin WrbA
MNIMIFTSSPNEDGLTAACGNNATTGVERSGAKAQIVNLNKKNIRHCQACEQGWGICLTENRCIIDDDDFNVIHESMADMDAYIIITPVYWWDMSESAKVFFDRLRRCEARNKKSRVAGKPFLCVAAAGGTGNGCVSCLSVMEKLVDHISGDKFDFIHVIQKNRTFKLETIKQSAQAMVRYIEQEKCS